MPYISTPTPSATKQIGSMNYLSSINDRATKEYFDAMLIDRFGEYHGGSFFHHMDMFGATKRIVNNSDFRHAEKPRIWQSMGIAASGAGITAGTTFAGTVAGNPIGIQIATADHTSAGTANASTFARIGDSVEVIGRKKGRIVYRDTGVAATSVLPTGVSPGDYGGTTSNHVIVVYPFKATTVMGTPGLTVGSRFRVYGNSNIYGSDSRESLGGDLIEWQGSFQILREYFEVDGSAAAQVGWIEVPYADGGCGYVWVWNQHLDQKMRCLTQIDDTCIFGEGKSSTAAELANISTTSGMLDEIQAGGYTHNYTAGFWSMADWNVLIKYLTRNGGAPENLLYSGMDWRIQAVDKFQETFDKGAIVYNNFNQAAKTTQVYGRTGEEIALRVGFSSFSKLGFTFHLYNYEGFDHPERAGLEGLGYGGDAFMVPMDNRNIYVDGGQNTTLQKSCEIAILGAEGYERDLQHWVHGGAIIEPGKRTSGVDKMKFEWLMEFGVWPKALNRFAYIKQN